MVSIRDVSSLRFFLPLHLHFVRGHEFAAPVDDGHAVSFQQGADIIGQLDDYPDFAREHRRQIQGDFTDANAVRRKLFTGHVIMFAGIQ